MAKKFYSVNCHYDMVITVDVIAESEDEAIELAKQNADFASIDQWAECYDSSECIADEQELTDELQKQAEEQQAMFDEKDEQEAVMVLYFVDEDNTKDMLLAARKSDLEAGNKRQEIEQCLRETFNIDERKEWEDCDPEGMDRGLQKAADKLAKGEQAYFDTYDFAWEKVSII